MLSGMALDFAAGYTGVIRPLKAVEGPSGDVYSTGWFRNTADFDPGLGVFELTSRGGENPHTPDYSNSYITRLTGDGQHIHTIPILSEHRVTPRDLLTDSAGNLFITGTFQEDADFDGSEDEFILRNRKHRTFIAKYDAELNLLWARRFAGGGNELAYQMDIDGLGNIYLAGRFDGTIDFDPGRGDFKLIGQHDGYVTVLNNDGELLTVHHLNGDDGAGTESGHIQVFGIDVDDAGNIAIVGGFNGTIDIDPGQRTREFTAVGQDVFVARINPGGRMTWAGQVSGPGFEGDPSVKIDAITQDLVFAFGSASGGVDGPFVTDVDPGPGTDYRETADRGLSSFITRVSADGEYLCTIQMGRPVRMNFNAPDSPIVIDDQSNVFASGYITNGEADVDPLGSGYVVTTDVTKPFLARYNRDGKLSSFVTTETGGGATHRMTIASDNSVYLTLLSVENADLDPGPGRHIVDDGQYIWKLKPASKFILPADVTSVMLSRHADEVRLVDATNGRTLMRKSLPVDELVISAELTQGVSIALDNTAGDPLQTSVKLVGSSGDDVLTVISGDHALYRPDTKGATISKVVIDGHPVRFRDIEAAKLMDLGSVEVRTTGAADEVILQETDHGTRIRSISDGLERPTVHAAGASSIVIDTGGGGDLVSVHTTGLPQLLRNLSVRAGYGADRVEIIEAALNPKSVAPTIHIEAGPGRDTLQASLNSDVRLSATRLVSELGTIRTKSFESAGITGGPVANTLNARAFPGEVTLRGLQGDDVLLGSGQNDLIIGDEGNDLIDGGRGADLLRGSAGDDTLHGREGRDTILGGDGHDDLRGGDDADLLNGGSGMDTLNGGRSADLFRVNGTSGRDVLRVEAAGLIKVQRSTRNGPALAAVIQGAPNDTLAIALGGGPDTIWVDPAIPINGSVDGGRGDDQCGLPPTWEHVSCDG